jgi:hypothetical protein
LQKCEKRVSHFYFLKMPCPLFFSCETYPVLEVSMGEKMKEKRKNLAGGLPQITPSLLGCYPTLFSFKKKETHFCLLETPEERELDKFCVHVLLVDWACHAAKRPMRWSGKG